MFESVLIANRGVIARRIIRTLRRMRVRSIAVFTAADARALHLREADEAIALPEAAGSAGYADADAILAAARAAGAAAIHPGYGFLGEDAAFAERCRREGIAFIGPTPAQIRAFGFKPTARAHARLHGIPLVAASPVLGSWDHARMEASRLGYPVMLKRTSGGGGHGLRRCADETALRAAFEAAAAGTENHGTETGLYLERYLAGVRHLEVQLFGDGRGEVVVLGERDCSLQRRHQKIIEESPAPNLSSSLRAVLHASAKRLVSGVGYESAGTAEFLYDPTVEQFYFLEFNPRLQVEHGVTEAVFGIDLVEWMVRQAAGELDLSGWRGGAAGVAIQARVYAEDPARGFQPSPGRLTEVRWPEGPGIRVETAVASGSDVPAAYDPLIAKVIAGGDSRAEAVRRLRHALADTQVWGCETNAGLLRQVTATAAFGAAEWSTEWIEAFPFSDARIEVVAGGHETTLQDLPGRVGHWAVGVPPSGPMDGLSFQLANRLVGNPPAAAALECTLRGPTLRFTADAQVAIVGADMGPTVDGVSVPQGERVTVRAGATLRLAEARGGGCRTYVAVAGGLDAPRYLGSRATFPAGSLGGAVGRALREGDVVRFAHEGEPTPIGPPGVLEAAPFSSEWSLRVLVGPQADPDYFTTEGLEALLRATWRVHAQSSRVGIRLAGPPPQFARADGGEAGLHPSNIHDSPYTIGAVNFAGDSPVILGCDGPSLGGFVCPFTVVEADRWKLGQLRSGDAVRFEVTTGAEAREAWRIQAAAVAARRWPTQPGLHPPPVRRPPAVLREVPGTATTPAVRYRQFGDTAVLVQYGGEALDLGHRFRVQALMERLAGEVGPWLAELAPGVSTLLVRYAPEHGSSAELVERLAALEASLPDPMSMTLRSRKVRLPLAFDAGSTQAAIRRYARTVRQEAPWVPSNIDYLRRLNGLADRAAVAERLFRATYLVLGLGDVFLGSPCAVALDPRDRLIATKYNPARTWTPEGEVGLGGVCLCIYGMESPGGYQLVGRTLPVWETYPGGGELPWRLRAFDRLEFYPVAEAELDRLRQKLVSGRATFDVQEEEFRVADYQQFLAAQADSIAAHRARQVELLRSAGRGCDGAAPTPELPGAPAAAPPSGEPLRAPVAGVVSAWKVAVGESVVAGQPVVVIEAMKLETVIAAPRAGRVAHLHPPAGGAVCAGDPLLWLAAIDPVQP